jgi:uracil-DNA glycosylase family protein
MKRLLLEPDFTAWRTAAREALRTGYRPQDIDLQDATVPAPLSLALELDEAPGGPAIEHPHVPKAFLEAAEVAGVHRSPTRWNLLYRVLYRLQLDRNLLKIETDDDVAELLRLEAQVRRDLHKMHAFVRFRKVLEPGDPSERPLVVDEELPIQFTAQADEEPVHHHILLQTPTPFGPVTSELEACNPSDTTPGTSAVQDCEHFIAWYQPDHRIVPMAAPFFAERFSIMRWSILTPDASVSWDPTAKRLTFAPGVPRESAPAEDELETLWRSYYSSIYNPARLNPQAMKSEMPVRYWRNLPEVAMLPTLITQSKTRVQTMVARQQQQPTAQPWVPEDHTLSALNSALPQCKGCDLYCHATQVVPGRGAPAASLMLVGEQPGDQEDRRGEPFVGPAGAVLDQVLDDLRIPRSSLYVTNAVKHFKFVQRGKLRLHQNPRMSEIMACRPWLLAELDAVKPKVVLCLGASASKSLLGGTFALMKDHGKQITTPFAERVFATIHPSAVLRARDEPNRQQLQAFLHEDLGRAWRASLE